MNDRTGKQSQLFKLKVWGRNACFTRPEMKVLWKPAIRWHITQIDVLKPIKWESVRRNEVGAVMSPRTSGLFIEDERQQRAGLLLRDVAYNVHAYFEMTEWAGVVDNLAKFEEMFQRRARKGQCFHRPYLGCREFAADFAPVNGDMPTPIDESRNLGWILYDMDFSGKEPMPRFFHAKLEKGSVKVPAFDSKEVRG
jgi:CRISPR-associated protein Cas5d